MGIDSDRTVTRIPLYSGVGQSETREEIALGGSWNSQRGHVWERSLWEQHGADNQLERTLYVV